MEQSPTRYRRVARAKRPLTSTSVHLDYNWAIDAWELFAWAGRKLAVHLFDFDILDVFDNTSIIIIYNIVKNIKNGCIQNG